MKGMCQTCGAVAPIDWFLVEPIRRQFEAVLVALPKPVEEQAFFYLALFRPATGRSLTPKKALRVLTDLQSLVATGFVAVRGRVDRNCPGHIWAAAMETMVNQRHSLSLPMPNHNYLTKVAYDLADTADKDAERRGTACRAPTTIKATACRAPIIKRSALDILVHGQEGDINAD